MGLRNREDLARTRADSGDLDDEDFWDDMDDFLWEDDMDDLEAWLDESSDGTSHDGQEEEE